MSVNKVILIGRTGKDPEFKQFENGSVCNISLATNETWKDRQTGEKKESTEWHNLVFRNKQAETAEKWIKKGTEIYVEGKLKTRSWGEEGDKKYITEVIVREFKFIGAKNNADASHTSNSDVNNILVNDATVVESDDLPF